MCLKDSLEIRSRGSSPVSVSSNSSGTDDSVDEPNPRPPRAVRLVSRRSSSALQEHGLHITAGTLVSATVTGFSWYLPFLLAPTAALRTYVYAQWDYDAAQSQFDNSIGTFGTDYFLALCMLLLIPLIPCPPSSPSLKQGGVEASSFHKTGFYTRGLLASYMISVAAGGWAHQFYTTVESQNTLPFRLLWTVCVGAVAIASGFMGAAATSLLRLDPDLRLALAPPRNRSGYVAKRNHFQLPMVPESFWFAYAIGIVAIVIYGGFSFQRPACDIFVVGITQFPSTFYMMLILWWGLRQYPISDRLRLLGCIGFIFNAPLLPMYPILVQYTDWPLGGINTLLHTWLLIAWTGQGLALRQVGRAVMERTKTLTSEHIS
jgi:hypothetical protein